MRKRAFASLVLACLLSALFLGGGCQVPTGEEATGPAVGAPQQSAAAVLPSAVPDAEAARRPRRRRPLRRPSRRNSRRAHRDPPLHG